MLEMFQVPAIIEKFLLVDLSKINYKSFSNTVYKIGFKRAKMNDIRILTHNTTAQSFNVKGTPNKEITTDIAKK